MVEPSKERIESNTGPLSADEKSLLHREGATWAQIFSVGGPYEQASDVRVPLRAIRTDKGYFLSYDAPELRDGTFVHFSTLNEVYNAHLFTAWGSTHEPESLDHASKAT